MTTQAQNKPDQDKVADEAKEISLRGKIVCLTEELDKRFNVLPECDKSHHVYSLKTADGKLYLQDEKGLGVVVKPGKQFQILAQNDLAERSLASYAVIGSDLLIRTEGNLYRIKK